MQRAASPIFFRVYINVGISQRTDHGIDTSFGSQSLIPTNIRRIDRIALRADIDE
jgi:hypothetical protein